MYLKLKILKLMKMNQESDSNSMVNITLITQFRLIRFQMFMEICNKTTIKAWNTFKNHLKFTNI